MQEILLFIAISPFKILKSFVRREQAPLAGALFFSFAFSGNR